MAAIFFEIEKTYEKFNREKTLEQVENTEKKDGVHQNINW